MSWEIRSGDCIDLMREMDAASVDAIVCDPPYGIGFMGSAWDGTAIAEAAERDRATRKSLASASRPGRAQARSSSAYGNEAIIAGPVRGGRDFQAWCESWASEALRVLKPGGHLLAFGGTRTYHRLVSGVEDAGFEIRDTIEWLYGSGFPKSLNIGDGRGTALKPAHEPIVVARKPLCGTVTANVQKYGTAALNIDACRIGTGGHLAWSEPRDMGYHGGSSTSESVATESTSGRWPANLVLSHAEGCRQVGERRVKGDPRETGNGRREGGFVDVGSVGGDSEPNAPVYGEETVPIFECVEGCPVAELDAQSGETTSTGGSGPATVRSALNGAVYGAYAGNVAGANLGGLGDTGGASRFFYIAKASSAERNAGLEGFQKKTPHEDAGHVHADGRVIPGSRATPRANSHPTVKPIDLMRWLVRLVTPPNGTVLDPFTGSGTTGIAAVLEGFDFIGLEREPQYVEIAKARIAWWAQHPQGIDLATALRAGKEREAIAARGQASIWDQV